MFIVELWYSHGGDCSAIIAVNADTKEEAEKEAKALLKKSYEGIRTTKGYDASLDNDAIFLVEAKQCIAGILFLNES